MVIKDYYSLSEVAELLGKSPETLRRWDNNGKLTALREPMSNYRVYKKEQLKIFDELNYLFNNEIETSTISPKGAFNVLELFDETIV